MARTAKRERGAGAVAPSVTGMERLEDALLANGSGQRARPAAEGGRRESSAIAKNAAATRMRVRDQHATRRLLLVRTSSPRGIRRCARYPAQTSSAESALPADRCEGRIKSLTWIGGGESISCLMLRSR